MIKSSLRPVKDQDVFDYIATFDGILFMFWLLVKNESEFKTFDEFQSIVSIDDIKAVQEVITSAMGAENFQKAQAIAVEKGYRGQQLAPDSANIMDGI